MAAEPTLADLVGALQAQLPTAEIIGVAQNQTADGGAGLADVVELTLRVSGHLEALVYVARYDELYSGFLVVSLNAYVENILRIYALGEGGPATIVPPPGSGEPPGPTIGPGPVPG